MCPLWPCLEHIAHTLTDGVGEVYQQLKSILGTTTVQHVESSLQHQVEASALTPNRPRHREQRATQGAPEVATTSTQVRI
jgi:hypothetical protein